MLFACGFYMRLRAPLMFLRRVLCAKPAQAHAGSFRADIIVGPICSQTLYLCAQVIFLLYRSLLRRDFAQEFSLNHIRVLAERKITCAPSAKCQVCASC